MAYDPFKSPHTPHRGGAGVADRSYGFAENLPRGPVRSNFVGSAPISPSPAAVLNNTGDGDTRPASLTVPSSVPARIEEYKIHTMTNDAGNTPNPPSDFNQLVKCGPSNLLFYHFADQQPIPAAATTPVPPICYIVLGKPTNPVIEMLPGMSVEGIYFEQFWWATNDATGGVARRMFSAYDPEARIKVT